MDAISVRESPAAWLAFPPRRRNPPGAKLKRHSELVEPTDALPGTAAKIEVLTERARRHQPLFHPLDAVIGD